MSKILFTWEIGEGTGHVAPYLDLIHSLEDSGHEISFALKSLNSAHRIFQDTQVRFFQAPHSVVPPHSLVRPVNSFPKILHNTGYLDVEILAGLIRSWRNLYDVINPDLVIFDYSPTAMLAARQTSFKRMAIGDGFYQPPLVRPIPGLAAAQGMPQDPKKVLMFEDQMLEQINHAMTLNNLDPLGTFIDMFDTDKTVFRTFAEMDHYYEREGVEYSGIFKSSSGFKPDWPNGKGKKIFAYIKPFKTLPSLLGTLNKSQLPTLLYGDGISKKIEKKFASDTLHFVERPLDMKTMGKTADIAICNGNHGTTIEMLLAGVPLLLLPQHAEQNMVSRNVVRLGAGLSAPKLLPEGMATKLVALVKDDSYRQAAQSFAKKYQDFNSVNLTKKLSDDIELLLN